MPTRKLGLDGERDAGRLRLLRHISRLLPQRRFATGIICSAMRGVWRAATLKSAMQKAVEAQAQEISKIAI